MHVTDLQLDICSRMEAIWWIYIHKHNAIYSLFAQLITSIIVQNF
jgi:hypothetical protein